jgi:hypothetical protein
MAFSKTGLMLIGGSKAGNAPQLWTYKTADTIATVNSAGYFDDGATTNTGVRTLMTVGDVIIVYGDTGGTPALVMLYVNSNTSGIIDVTDGTTITATDTD